MRKEVVERTLYSYDELEGTAQDKALENLWDINIDYEWYDFIEYDIENFGKVSGLDCRYGHEFDLDRESYLHIKSIGCSFSDLESNLEKAKTAYPDVTEQVLLPFFKDFSEKEKRQLKRLEKGGILVSMNGETSRDRKQHVYDLDTTYYNEDHPHIHTLLTKLENEWESLLINLEYYYICLLRREYEYRTSREAIEESIRCNEYEFLEDGTLA